MDIIITRLYQERIIGQTIPYHYFDGLRFRTAPDPDGLFV